MKEIKLYLDLEQIEKETGVKFDSESEYSDNFLQRIQYLAWSGLDSGESENEKRFRKKNAEELYNILKNVQSEWSITHLQDK